MSVKLLLCKDCRRFKAPNSCVHERYPDLVNGGILSIVASVERMGFNGGGGNCGPHAIYWVSKAGDPIQDMPPGDGFWRRLVRWLGIWPVDAQ